MGDRKQRAQGKAKELKGRAKQEAGIARGKPATEAQGAGEELKGKAQNAAGKARSAIKRATR
ncbi:MAG TPA: CsbD family protein [Solirubrobacteraceae bacterium]